MSTVEQRVAYLEGQVNEQSQAFSAIRDSLGRFQQQVDARFNAVDTRFNAVDTRFNAVDTRFNAIDARFNAVDARFNTLEQRMDARFNALDNKMSTQFLWIMGVQVTVLVAVLAALLSRG